MVRKMALVPADMAAQFSLQQHLPGVPTLNQLSLLDQQMKNILEDKNMPADMKYKQYFNTLHRYDALQENSEQKPIPVAVREEKPQQKSHVLPVSENELLENVPITQRRGTRLLMKYIKDNPDITWNNANEMVYKGERIPQSNIYDLVADISRNRRNQRPAVGWYQLAEALTEQNIPETAIGNKQRWAELRQDAVPQMREDVAAVHQRYVGKRKSKRIQRGDGRAKKHMQRGGGRTKKRRIVMWDSL